LKYLPYNFCPETFTPDKVEVGECEGKNAAGNENRKGKSQECAVKNNRREKEK